MMGDIISERWAAFSRYPRAQASKPTTGWQSFEEFHHLATANLLPDDDLLGRIDAMDLKHVLGDIQTDRGNLHVDGSPCGLSERSPYGESSPGAGAVHHIRSGHMQCRPYVPSH
jgi:hypothetical protein